tara:strand:+ start:4314 stop:4895 length:582 start_codon:yes stop_codon:yes gene_type:complete
MHNKITYTGELYRKSIHISSSFFAFSLYFWGKEKILIPLICITIIYLLFDFSRRNHLINKLYLDFFHLITRNNEKRGNLTGASYVFLGILITIFFFDQKIAIPAILIMSLSDSSSAIIGRKYNYTRIKLKTLEGSIAFFFTTLMILFFFNIDLLYSIIISFILVFIEYFDRFFIDDNLSLPIFSAILIQLVIK